MEPSGKAIDLTGKQKELTSELAAASLDNALDSCDVESFMKLLGEVIKARLGYGAMARSAGLNRTALYKIASPKGNPALHTLVSLLTLNGAPRGRLHTRAVLRLPALQGSQAHLQERPASNPLCCLSVKQPYEANTRYVHDANALFGSDITPSYPLSFRLRGEAASNIHGRMGTSSQALY